MRELFVIDKQNYDKNGTVFERPSVRGIIIENNLVAMMHSKKYNYYKLPGGGIENTETHEQTLIREVREESGLVVIHNSIKEFGYVRRIEKGKYEDIFIQDNYYYLCKVESEKVLPKLDEYEKEEQFVLEYVLPQNAINTNKNADHKEKNKISAFWGMIERENRILEILTEEIF
ncbi:MAG: NUDIX domain-containing protein [Oscillospiraceae bacterium]|nr:NUDIX domain-containing protein [Oscillospiraceae bacterium]